MDVPVTVGRQVCERVNELREHNFKRALLHRAGIAKTIMLLLVITYTLRDVIVRVEFVCTESVVETATRIRTGSPSDTGRADAQIRGLQYSSARRRWPEL